MNTKTPNLKLVTFCALISQCIFGFSFMFSSVALEVTTPIILLGFRFSVAFLLLNLLRATGHFPVNLKGKPIYPLLLLGLFQPVSYFLCENYGLLYTNSSFTGIMIAVIPIVGIILAAFFLKEIPTRFQTLCTIAAIIGVILTNLGNADSSIRPIGVVLLAGAVLTAAIFTLLSRSVSQTYTAMERTYVMFALGTAVFLPMALIQGSKDFTTYIIKPCMTPSFWLSVFYLAAFSSVGAYMLLNYALTYLTIAKSVIFACMSTVISIFAGVLVLGETFTFLQGLGSVIILVGVIGASLSKS